MKIIIVGGKAKERYLTDVKHDDEVWALNGQMCGGLRWLPKVSRAFNLHRFKLLKDYKYDLTRESEWAHEHRDAPFVTVDKWPTRLIPQATILPRREMAKSMPRGDYHCGSFDWMVAYAVYLSCALVIAERPVEEISLHGIGLCLEPGEPISARACLEYWCGYAEGRGIEVTAADDCDPFHHYHLVKSNLVYGVDDTPIYEDRTKRGKPYDYGK